VQRSFVFSFVQQQGSFVAIVDQLPAIDACPVSIAEIRQACSKSSANDSRWYHRR
jgi:hypothetical protein